MPWFDVFWTDERVEKLAEHGVSQDDFERIVMRSANHSQSRSGTGREVAFGKSEDGRHLICVYELLGDGVTVLPITAYEVPERKRRKR